MFLYKIVHVKRSAYIYSKGKRQIFMVHSHDIFFKEIHYSSDNLNFSDKFQVSYICTELSWLVLWLKWKIIAYIQQKVTLININKVKIKEKILEYNVQYAINSHDKQILYTRVWIAVQWVRCNSSVSNVTVFGFHSVGYIIIIIWFHLDFLQIECQFSISTSLQIKFSKASALS